VVTYSANLISTFEQAMGRKAPMKGASVGTQGEIHDGAGDISAMVDAINQGSSVPKQPAKNDEEEAATNQEATKSLDFFYGSRRLNSVKIDPQLMSAAPSLFMQAAMSAKQIVGLTHSVAKDCLHQDALVALDRAAEHMQNVNYVSGHLIANGADILTELADSVTSYKGEDYKKFGSDLGGALRKVLLSNTADSSLPEGLPGKEVLANVSNGLLRGLFGEGAELDLKLPGDIDHVPTVIQVDLHRCVSDNLKFFQEAWAEVMFFYAKHAAGAVAEQDKLQWATAVGFTMLQVPDVMTKCSLGTAEQEALEDAVKGLASGGAGISFDYKAPSGSEVSKDLLENHMAITVKDWAKMRWKNFGIDLGHLLQEMAVTVYDQKYVVDNRGILRQRILDLSAGGAPAGGIGATAVTAALATAALVAFVGLATLLRAAKIGQVAWLAHSDTSESEDDSAGAAVE